MIDQAYKSMTTMQNMVNGTLNYKIDSNLSFNVIAGSIWTEFEGLRILRKKYRLGSY